MAEACLGQCFIGSGGAMPIGGGMVVAVVDGKWWGRREHKICMLSPGASGIWAWGWELAIVNSLLWGRREHKICTLSPGASGIWAWRQGGDV